MEKGRRKECLRIIIFIALSMIFPVTFSIFDFPSSYTQFPVCNISNGNHHGLPRYLPYL